jgi:hypothetical protein
MALILSAVCKFFFNDKSPIIPLSFRFSLVFPTAPPCPHERQQDEEEASEFCFNQESGMIDLFSNPKLAVIGARIFFALILVNAGHVPTPTPFTTIKVDLKLPAVTVVSHYYKGSGEPKFLKKIVAEGGGSSFESIRTLSTPSAQFPPSTPHHVEGLPARAHRLSVSP